MKKKLSLLLAALMLLGILSACTVNDEAGGNQPAPSGENAPKVSTRATESK